MADQSHLERTDDAYLYRLWIPEEEQCFWVDQLDQRFWSFHTNMPVARASRYLKKQISSRHDLDWVWLPSDHLRTVWPNVPARGVRSRFQGQLLRGEGALDDVRLKLTGRSAEFVLDYLSKDPEIRSAVPFDGIEVRLDDPELGNVTEAVDRMGRFAVSGNSIEFHVQFVETVIARYRKLVEACEQKALSWTALDRSYVESGGRLAGIPIVINFSSSIDDMESFVDSLFSSREPFRLWGVPRIEDDFAEIEAVDLHVGGLLRMDIGRKWMRIYLPNGGCGNSIARLASNLQHRFDATLSFADPEIQAALEGISKPHAAGPTGPRVASPDSRAN